MTEVSPYVYIPTQPTYQQGIIYHPKFNPPPPEVVPRLIWRTDDTPETLTRRLQVYREKTLPIYGKLAVREE